MGCRPTIGAATTNPKVMLSRDNSTGLSERNEFVFLIAGYQETGARLGLLSGVVLEFCCEGQFSPELS